LEPGRYTFFHHVTAPPNVRILCSGIGVTVLRRVHNPNDYEDEFFEATGAMTLEDATFESDPNYPGAIVVHVTPPTNDSGTIIRRIRCVQTQGFWIGGAGDWIDDIEFDGGCPFANQSNQLWTNILFKNIGHDPLVSGVGTAAINWTFEGTNRGFVMRSGPTQSLFENIVFRNVQQCPNGDELMLAEDPPSASNPNPPGVQGCYFSHIFAQHCNGTLLHLGATPASNNLWRSMMADGGLGILFNAAGTDQSGNQLQDIELRNGLGIGFIGATGNTLNGIAIVNPQVTRGNQNDWQATYYGRHEAISGLSGNRATQISIRGLSAGWISGLPDDALDQ
jgi:hypothetical protein